MSKTREEILGTQVSFQFIEGMKDRMIIGYHKYGPVDRGFPSRVNAIESLRLRLKQYEDTGNTEYLMDVANYAMIEFMRPAHPKAHYKPTDDKETPGYVTNDFEIDKRPTDQLTEESWNDLQKHREELKRNGL